jgi:hypothetical protein
MEVNALAEEQYMEFTECLHRMFLNEMDMHGEIKSPQLVSPPLIVI